MSIQIPSFMVGKNVSLFGCTPQGVGTGGVLVPQTAFDMHSLGVLDDATWEGDPGLVSIMPTDAAINNYVPTAEDFTITLGEIIKSDGSSQTLLTAFGFNYMRVQWVVTPPWGSGGFTFAAIGVIGPSRTGVTTGKNASQITLRPCGILPYYGNGTPPF